MSSSDDNYNNNQPGVDHDDDDIDTDTIASNDDLLDLEDIYDRTTEELVLLLQKASQSSQNSESVNRISKIQRELEERQATERLIKGLTKTESSESISSGLASSGKLNSLNNSDVKTQQSSVLTQGHQQNHNNQNATSFQQAQSQCVQQQYPSVSPASTLVDFQKSFSQMANNSTHHDPNPIPNPGPIQILSNVDITSTNIGRSSSSINNNNQLGSLGNSSNNFIKKVSTRGNSGLLNGFKPTPVAFDFVVASSSARNHRNKSTSSGISNKHSSSNHQNHLNPGNPKPKSQQQQTRKVSLSISGPQQGTGPGGARKGSSKKGQQNLQQKTNYQYGQKNGSLNKGNSSTGSGTSGSGMTQQSMSKGSNSSNSNTNYSVSVGKGSGPQAQQLSKSTNSSNNGLLSLELYKLPTVER